MEEKSLGTGVASLCLGVEKLGLEVVSPGSEDETVGL